jgi:hypothetical protein
MAKVLFHFDKKRELGRRDLTQDQVDVENRRLRNAGSMARWVHPAALTPDWISEMQSLVYAANISQKILNTID